MMILVLLLNLLYMFLKRISGKYSLWQLQLRYQF